MKPNLRTNLGRFLLGAVLLLAAGTVWAQPQNIRGKITDPAGQPVAGASVIVKGTTNGTSAKADGTFELGAAKGATLQITMLGYKTAEKEVTTATFYPITLEDDSKLVNEVVVVGYGAVKKSDLTGSVASVKMGALDNLSSTSVDGLLQGRAAGLQVLNTSQDPGAGAIVRIRGNSSLEGSNTPLVVVNGFPMGDAGNLSQINVSDIQSIEILKDASASAIYGSRGANGVILVTTKSAAKGQTNISVKHQTVISQLSDPLDIWYDPMLMAQVTNEEQVNAGLNPIYIGQTIGGIYYPSLLEIQNGEWANTDWRDLCLRTPVLNSTTAAISSANDRASINLNVNYHNNQGLYKKDSYERINANLGVTYNLYKNLKLTSYNVFSITNRNISNGLEYGRNPLWPVYDKEGNYYLAGAQDFGHPLVILDNVLNKTTGRDFVTSLAVDWELVKGLTIHSQLDYRYQTSVGDVYRASNTSQDANDNGGIAQINNSFNQNLMSETYLTFSRTFNENHALTVMAGHSYNWDTGRGLYTTARGFVNDVLQNENMNAGNPNLRQIYNDGYYLSKLLSFYGRINYSLKDKYLLTATMRADGSTKFGKNNKWGYFPSGAVSWKMRLTADVYYKKTTDLLHEKYLSLSSSYDKIWVNDGEVTNKGFEVSLEGDIVHTRDWSFSATFIYSMNRNKVVVSLGDAISSGLSQDYLTGMYYEVTGEPVSMFNQNASIYAVGHPMNVFYGYRVDGIIQEGQDPGFIDPDGLKDRPGELKYVDLTG